MANRHKRIVNHEFKAISGEHLNRPDYKTHRFAITSFYDDVVNSGVHRWLLWMYALFCVNLSCELTQSAVFLALNYTCCSVHLRFAIVRVFMVDIPTPQLLR